MLSALRVRFEDASVCGVLDTDWLWLFLTTPSLWLSRELPETALTLDPGRCWEVMEEAVGGGMGEGSRRLLLLLLVVILVRAVVAAALRRILSHGFGVLISLFCCLDDWSNGTN